MISVDKITTIFCIIDDFQKEFKPIVEKYSLKVNSKNRRRKSKLSESEVMCILICFHLSGVRNLKHFYLKYVKKHLQAKFPQTVSIVWR